MSSTSTDLIERLYRRLLEAALGRDGEAPSQLTIGDIYQDLIPYRSVRGELGIFELAQYENALLRLLAGEGEFLRLMDAAAGRELAAELTSPNPILGIYRDYPSARVELLELPVADSSAEIDARSTSPGAADTILDVGAFTADVDEELEKGNEETDGAEQLPEIRYPAPVPVPADATRVERPAAAPPQGAPEGAGGESSASCLACRQLLPDVAGLHYCPHCGADQTEVPCERCASPIRSDWNFCIRCGSPRPAHAPPV